MLSSLRFIPRLDLYTWYMWAKSILQGEGTGVVVSLRAPGLRSLAGASPRMRRELLPVGAARNAVLLLRLEGPGAPTYPGRSPGSSPGALDRQAGGGCALGIRSMALRAGATVRSCLQESVGRGLSWRGPRSSLREACSESELPERRWRWALRLRGAAASVGGVRGVPAASGSDSARSLVVCAACAVCAVRAK